MAHVVLATLYMGVAGLRKARNNIASPWRQAVPMKHVYGF